MLHLSSTVKYYLYRSPADMRKGFDSLSGIVSSQMQRSASGGDIFIFLNRNRTHIKLLLWESDGFALYYKTPGTGNLRTTRLQRFTYHDAHHLTAVAIHTSGSKTFKNRVSETLSKNRPWFLTFFEAKIKF